VSCTSRSALTPMGAMRTISNTGSATALGLTQRRAWRGARDLGLGTNLPGFECGTFPCTDIPTAGLTGTFTITEHVQGFTSADMTINQGPSSNNDASSLGFPQNPILVTTHITNDSNLLGFQESFIVPEPGTIVLFTSGLLGIAALRRCRKTRREPLVGSITPLTHEDVDIEIVVSFHRFTSGPANQSSE
jgi:hypothetical protein